ncbi:MAG: septal ring lytic transglycosylase RlpA family lipoprotein [Bacteroidetes bacterium SW_9_63_38]|nr:MAG: septal ring lytic transglycosylase RlpA family lipoprotein [Bacteroidetes bacterium SW_9_63_38]
MSIPLSSSLRLFLLTSVVGLLAMMTACLGSGQSADRLPDQTRGEASYYGDKFAGRTTANGETFDPSEMTAAHPSLPFDTRVRVTRVKTGRSVTVRINDRGPYADGRIIDLSKAAAQRLGMIQKGVVDVRIDVLERPDDSQATSSREPSGDDDQDESVW